VWLRRFLVRLVSATTETFRFRGAEKYWPLKRSLSSPKWLFRPIFFEQESDFTNLAVRLSFPSPGHCIG
jgi:hypothetical protein